MMNQPHYFDRCFKAKVKLSSAVEHREKYSLNNLTCVCGQFHIHQFQSEPNIHVERVVTSSYLDTNNETILLI